MRPNELEQHMIELGLLSLEELQALKVSPAIPKEPRKPIIFRDPRDSAGEVPF